jgi:hypothetical protein
MTATEQFRPNAAAARSGQTPVKIVTASEARRGFMTTEFWLSLVIAAAVVIAGYADDSLAVEQAWALATGVVAAYVLSRGFAKAGSSEPDVRDLDVDAR